MRHMGVFARAHLGKTLVVGIVGLGKVPMIDQESAE